MAQKDISRKDADAPDAERREVLRKIASTVFASLLAPAVFAEGASEAKTDSPDALPPLPEPQPGEDPLVRMMRDLQKALRKPVEQRRWVMVIDLRKCVGCHACTIACVSENKLPPGVVYRPVLEEEIGTFPNVTRRFLPRPCMHCDSPPCVAVCPVNEFAQDRAGFATYKNEEGMVVMNYDECIGCQTCIPACPYDARHFDSGRVYAEGTPDNVTFLVGQSKSDDYERAASFEYGKKRERDGKKPPIEKVRKCHFCLHRLAKGFLPQCVTSCIGRATCFGDAHDPESVVSQLISQPNVMRLKEDLGTRPRVYYLT